MLEDGSTGDTVRPAVRGARRRIQWLVASANLLGGLVVFLYFTLLDLAPYGNVAFGWVELDDALAMVGNGLLAVFFARWLAQWQFRPIDAWLDAADDQIAARLPPARRAALNYPLVTALGSAGAWLISGLFWWGWATFDPLVMIRPDLTGIPERIAIGIIGIGGVFVCALTYLGADVLWRPIVPHLFANSRISISAGFYAPIWSRLLVVFLILGIWPQLLIAHIAFDRLKHIVGAAQPEPFIANFYVSTWFLIIASGAASFGLAALVSLGINDTLSALQIAMRRIQAGDLTARAAVASKDELGYLAEQFNEMTTGLAKAETVRQFFRMYVSPEVAEAAAERGVELGGTQVECTVLFSDMRDFTSLAERLPPTELIALLNRYMSRMIAVIVENGGILNKFGGDSILAIFGSPLNPTADHATRAVRAAIGMRQALVEFNVAESQRQTSPINIGIGVATGPVVAGNIGSHERLEYTVIGDAVNLASRLQDRCKELNCDILIAETTWRQASQTRQIFATPTPPLEIRGKHDRVVAFQLG